MVERVKSIKGTGRAVFSLRCSSFGHMYYMAKCDEISNANLVINTLVNLLHKQTVFKQHERNEDSDIFLNNIDTHKFMQPVALFSEIGY